MAALTGDVIVDRVRSLVSSDPFNFAEAESWDTFDFQPTTNVDAVFRIPPMRSGTVIGGFAYAEDRTDILQIWVARKVNSDFAGVRRALLRDVHSLTAAITRDGSEQSGDYNVTDEDRGHEIAVEEGAEFATLELTLSINYDSQL